MVEIVAAALAEGTGSEGAQEHVGITVPLIVGASVFLLLLVLLFVVTRFNPDR